MKLSFTTEEIERWRDRVHRRLPRLAVRTKEQAVQFINEVGFCFALTTEYSQLPCFWNAACGHRNPPSPRNTQSGTYRSFVGEMKRVLPAEGRVFYCHVFRRRPTMISAEYFPSFYALSQRTGRKDDFLNEYRRGGLSPGGKAIMEALTDSSPQVTRGLKIAVNNQSRSHKREFEKAMLELQTKFYIVKISGDHDPSTLEWNTVDKVFPALVRRAQKIRPEQARETILRKYFQNQLIGSVQTIQHLFGWKKQAIYEVLGRLMKEGVITGGVTVDGNHGKYYCLVD